MISKRGVNENIDIFSNKNGDIAFGNKKGITYMKGCIEEKEIKKYARENNIKTFMLPVPEFFVLGCFIYSVENDNKRNVL